MYKPCGTGTKDKINKTVPHAGSLHYNGIAHSQQKSEENLKVKGSSTLYMHCKFGLVVLEEVQVTNTERQGHGIVSPMG